MDEIKVERLRSILKGSETKTRNLKKIKDENIVCSKNFLHEPKSKHDHLRGTKSIFIPTSIYKKRAMGESVQPTNQHFIYQQCNGPL